MRAQAVRCPVQGPQGREQALAWQALPSGFHCPRRYQGTQGVLLPTEVPPRSPGPPLPGAPQKET